MTQAANLLKHNTDAVPSTGDMMAWITEVVDHGIRRPGTHAGDRVEQWALSRFRYLGLRDPRREPFEVSTWTPGPARLVAWPADRPAETIELAGFPLPYTQATAGHEADVVLLGDDAAASGSARGAIAVDVLALGRLPQDLVATVATAGIDARGELTGVEQLLPLGPRLGKEVDAAVEAGASGYVGVLADMPWTTRDYYVPYDAETRDLPAVWVDRDDGRALLALLAAGPVRGRIEVEGRIGTATTANVVGTLPGVSDEWVVVGSHHDAPWASAVEDGTGIALVLGQARFWAQVPETQRPHNMLFLLNGAHMAGGAGVWSFLDTHADLLDRVVLSLHLEHAAAAVRGEHGKLVPTGDPEIAWWFTSQDPLLEDAVVSALQAEEMRRSWVFPPQVFGEFPPTDGGPFHTRGVPLVDFLTAPVYLFDRADTLDMVHEPSLVPLTRTAIRIIASLADRTAAEVRAGVAAAVAATAPAEPTAPAGASAEPAPPAPA